MGLILRDVSVSGFGSYGPKPQRLTFGGRGPVAVIGENGAGKSTIVSKALTWCLYGKTAPDRMGGGTKTIRGDHVIAERCDTVRVTVRLTDDGTGTEYAISREKTRKKSDSLTITRIDASGEHALDPSQEVIESLVGASYDTFTRTVVRGQGDLWAFAEATDARKREVLDAVSGAAVLDAAHGRAVAARKLLDARVTDLRRRVDDIVSRGEAAKGRAQTLKAQSDDWNAARSGVIRAAEDDVAAAEAALADAEAADKGIATVKAQHDAVRAAMPTLDLTPYRDAVRAALTARNAAKVLHDTAEAEARRLEALSAGADCPTCGQVIAPDAPIATKQAEAVQAADNAKPEADNTETHYRAAVTAQKDAEVWLSDAMAKHRTEVQALPPLAGPQAPSARTMLDATRRKLATVKGEANPYTVAVGEARNQARNLFREAAMLSAMQAEANRELARAIAWADALHPKGARAHMASAALAAIERGANEWLSVLSDNRMSVEFPEDTSRETIGVKVTKDGVERDLLTFSGGERRRVNMAVDLGVSSAFAKGGLSLSLLVLDEEVFSGMDEAGKAAVVHALHGAGVADVVVVDHDPRLSAVLPRCVEVVRGPDGYSEVKGGA